MKRVPLLIIGRRSAICCVTSTKLLGELGHPGYGAGTFGAVRECCLGLFVPKTPFL